MSSSTVFSILGKNLRANTAQDLEPYLSELKAMENVEEVHFGGNSLGVEACQAIAEVLKGKKSLKVVDLADIFTGRLISEIPQALTALCTSLSHHESLVELDLSDNAFGGRCADAMVPFLRENTWFEIFKLNNNGLGIAGGIIISEALVANADKSAREGKKSALRTIVCGRNRLENGSSASWARAFEKLGGLREVRLPQNGIRMEGIKRLVKGLSFNKDLEVLDLQDNTATKVGTRSVVRYLPIWTELRTLNLSDCLLGVHGGIALARCLSEGSNKKLEVLKLQYGEFDKRAIELLAIYIANHGSALTCLELNGNRADEEDECIEEVKKALALHGHEDALDELDDMEEVDEDEESEGEGDTAEESEEEKEDEGKEIDGIARGEDDGGVLPAATNEDTDDLADMLAKVHVKQE
ncbi:Ran GTPase-activating protein 1, partial [Tremellales sp. Uapishka_1]